MIPRIVACIAVAVIGTTAIVGFTSWSHNVIRRWSQLEVKLTPSEIAFADVSQLLSKYIYIPITILLLLCIGFALAGPRRKDMG